jgi:hypothetical protein
LGRQSSGFAWHEAECVVPPRLVEVGEPFFAPGFSTNAKRANDIAPVDRAEARAQPSGLINRAPIGFNSRSRAPDLIIGFETNRRICVGYGGC